MSRPRRLRHGDDGAALLMVLAFIALVGVVAVAVSGFAFTTFKAREAVVRLDDTGASSGDVGEQLGATLRESGPLSSQCLENPLGFDHPVDIVVDQRATAHRVLSGTCTLRGSTIADSAFGQTFAAILTSAEAGKDDVPVFQKNGAGTTSFYGDVILSRAPATASTVCFRESPITSTGGAAACGTATSPGTAGAVCFLKASNAGACGQASSLSAQAQPALRVTSPTTADAPVSKVLNNTGTAGVVAPFNARTPDAAVLTGDTTDSSVLEPNWTIPDTAPLRDNPTPTTAACDYTGDSFGYVVPLGYFATSKNFSCIRFVAPGRYTDSGPLLTAATTSGSTSAGPCGGWGWESGVQKFISCSVRSVVFQPGVYRFDTDLIFKSRYTASNSLQSPYSADRQAPVVVAGTVNNPTGSPIVPTHPEQIANPADRCKRASSAAFGPDTEGVAFVFGAGYGVLYGIGDDSPPDFTACPATAQQLSGNGTSGFPDPSRKPGGRPGVVMFQYPGSNGESHAYSKWALLASKFDQSPLTLYGSVYAPGGRINATVGERGKSVSFGSGMVAYSLQIRTNNSASLGQDVTTQQAAYNERELDVNLPTCTPDAGFPDACANFEPYRAILAVGDDLATTGWVKAYLPPGSQ